MPYSMQFNSIIQKIVLQYQTSISFVYLILYVYYDITEVGELNYTILHHPRTSDGDRLRGGISNFIFKALTPEKDRGDDRRIRFDQLHLY